MQALGRGTGFRRKEATMFPRTLRHYAILGVLFAAPGLVHAGVNMWTGGRPAGTSSSAARSLVAAHPNDPDNVYATFQLGGYRSGLYRSGDGGRSWRRLLSFEEITALLVHPASPSTIYVGVTEFTGDTYLDRVYRSADAGETWSRVLDSRITVFAGSPADASVVFAGGPNVIHRTIDGGATWSPAGVDSLSGVMASLILDPREPETAYAGVEGYQYWGLYPGGLFKTTDGGDSWRKIAPEAEGISAIAVDSAAESTLYVATGLSWWGDEYEVPSSLLRSEDGGEQWTSAAEGTKTRGGSAGFGNALCRHFGGRLSDERRRPELGTIRPEARRCPDPGALDRWQGSPASRRHAARRV